MRSDDITQSMAEELHDDHQLNDFTDDSCVLDSIRQKQLGDGGEAEGINMQN